MGTNPQSLTLFKEICFRSSACAIAAYFYALILEKFLMIAGAAISGYPISIDYLDVGINVDSSAWTQDSVLLIYLFPYLVQAMLIVLLYINLQRMQSTPGYTMIFIHWVMFFIMFRLTAMLAVHMVCKTGIYYAFSWLYLGGFFELIIFFAGIIIFFIAGVWMLRGVLFFSAIYNNYHRAIGLLNTVRSSLLIPAFLACMIPCLYYLPGLPKDEIIGLTMVAIIAVYIVLRILYGKQQRLPKGESVKAKLNASVLFCSVLVFVIILRVLLGKGIAI